MVIQPGDPISAASGGRFEIRSASSLPATPTLSLSTSGTTTTATISGSDAGVTNYLLYKAAGAAAWSSSTRSGDGTIEVTGLELDVVYIFTAYSRDAENAAGACAPAQVVTVSDTADNAFDTNLAAEASYFASAFGEAVTYKPRGGGSRAISAVVFRKQPEPIGTGGAGVETTLAEIRVENNSSTGISAAELDTGGDKVTLAMRSGETAIDHRITQLLNDEDGMLSLEVR